MSKNETKKIVKKKLLGLNERDLTVWNQKKLAGDMTDATLLRSLLHGQESFGPLAERTIAAEMTRTGLPRPAAIESLLLRKLTDSRAGSEPQ